MLILTRRVGEVIRIGENITVEVMRVDGLQVRLGIKAPPQVRVDREEIAIKKARDERVQGGVGK